MVVYLGQRLFSPMAANDRQLLGSGASNWLVFTSSSPIGATPVLEHSTLLTLIQETFPLLSMACAFGYLYPIKLHTRLDIPCTAVLLDTLWSHFGHLTGKVAKRSWLVLYHRPVCPPVFQPCHLEFKRQPCTSSKLVERSPCASSIHACRRTNSLGKVNSCQLQAHQL